MPEQELAPPAQNRVWGWIAVTACTVIWGLTPNFARAFSGMLDAPTQNLVRYGAATVALWLMVLVGCRKQLGEFRPQWSLLALATVFCFTYQVSWVLASYYINSSMVHLLMKMNVLVGPLLAYAFEHSERDLIRSPRFLIGSALGLAGALGLVLGGEVEAAETAPVVAAGWAYPFAILLCVYSAFSWPAYSICAKRMSAQSGTVTFAYIALPSSLMFLVWTALQGNPQAYLDMPLWLKIVVPLTGVLGIAIGHQIYYTALRHLGVAICTVFFLTSPLVTIVIGYVFLEERLTRLQALAAVPLLLGCGIAFFRKTRPDKTSDEIPPPPPLPRP